MHTDRKHSDQATAPHTPSGDDSPAESARLLPFIHVGTLLVAAHLRVASCAFEPDFAKHKLLRLFGRRDDPRTHDALADMKI